MGRLHHRLEIRLRVPGLVQESPAPIDLASLVPQIFGEQQRHGVTLALGPETVVVEQFAAGEIFFRQLEREFIMVFRHVPVQQHVAPAVLIRLVFIDHVPHADVVRIAFADLAETFFELCFEDFAVVRRPFRHGGLPHQTMSLHADAMLLAEFHAEIRGRAAVDIR